MKDFRMSFWDANDDFTFEKQFMTTETDNFQTKIWFIEYLGLWLTTDKSNRLYSWDLQNERVSKTLDIREFRNNRKEPGAITSVKEIQVLKLIAVCSSDKEVSKLNDQKLMLFR